MKWKILGSDKVCKKVKFEDLKYKEELSAYDKNNDERMGKQLMKIPEHYECNICGKYIDPWEHYVTITPEAIDCVLSLSHEPKEFCMSCWDNLIKELKKKVKIMGNWINTKENNDKYKDKNVLVSECDTETRSCEHCLHRKVCEYYENMSAMGRCHLFDREM